jgi:hypothetical protein
MVDLRLLEGTTVTLRTVNQLDNITTSKVFEEVRLNENEEYLVEFQVPANIEEVQVFVHTSVNAVSRGAKDSFAASTTFKVDHHTNDRQFCEIFLTNVSGNYQYMIKGKNGEPISGVLVDVRFAHRYYHEEK